MHSERSGRGCQAHHVIRSNASPLGARAAFSFLALAITHFADLDLQAQLRIRIADKLGRLPLGWFSRTSSGAVRKSVQNDVADLHYLVAHATVEATAAMLSPIFALIYCFYLDWRLGLLAIATVPLYALTYSYMARDLTTEMEKMDKGVARISATIVEFISGVAVVKTFGQTGKAHRRFVDAADAALHPACPDRSPDTDANDPKGRQ